MPTTYAIPNGRTVFDATLYAGTGATNNVTNQLGFKPDLVWVKNRTSVNSHQLSDSVRGINLALASDLTIAEYSGNINAFNTNGFQVTTSSNAVNNSGQNYVGWQWQAGQGTTSSNTNGSITSTVSVNATAGFSIVTYTGTGSAGATVGHGLGVTPQFILIKVRSVSGDAWIVWSGAISQVGYLNLTDAFAAGARYTAAFNATAPTSSVITLGTSSGGTNTGSATYVAYCWAPVAGFSQFGSYTGNGSADGPFIYTGFRPKFVMFKNASAGSTNWTIIDSSRSPYNGAYLWLYPNVSDAEANPNAPEDLLSNGFKIRTDGSYVNGSGNTIIYAAFAENPLKFANAR